VAFQAKTKFFQIRPSQPKPEQRKSKTKGSDSFDFLVGNKPFQWVAPTPWAKNSLLAPFSAVHPADGGIIRDQDNLTRILIFRKKAEGAHCAMLTHRKKRGDAAMALG
jgi:hypothetical protein